MNSIKAILISILLLAQATSSYAVQLKNGAEANPQRVDAVWQALQNLNEPSPTQLNVKEYAYLLKVCQTCKQTQTKPCKLQDYENLYSWYHWDAIDPVILSEITKQKRENGIAEAQALFEQRAITKDGVIDTETQDIVISSFGGLSGPVKSLDLNGCWPKSAHPKKTLLNTVYGYIFGKYKLEDHYKTSGKE